MVAELVEVFYRVFAKGPQPTLRPCFIHMLAELVCRMEDESDRLYMKARQGHIERLTTGVCSPTADVVFTEILRNLERISDHADNLGVSVMRVE